MEHVDSNGKLNKSCFCRVCGCKILIAGAATYEDSEFPLPLQKNGEVTVEKQFWVLTKLMDFENIAFTHTQNNVKYLSCADCEREVIGYQNLDIPNKFFLSYSRVSYDEDKAKSDKQDRPEFTIPGFNPANF